MRILFCFLVLSFIAQPGAARGSEQTQNIVLDPLAKARLHEIGLLVVERKSNDEILKGWDGFVDRSRRIDYIGCIRLIFEEAKIEAENRAHLAQLKIDRANGMKEAVAKERTLIQSLRISLGQGKPLGKVPRKVFEAARDAIGGYLIKPAGFISSKRGLNQYEDYLQWGGREANLQGAGGVALLEFAKDAIQTSVSNITGVGTLQCQMKKIVERKIGGM
jgi:hypothetical protein